MKRYGELSVWEFTAADEIIAAHCMSAGLPVSRDPDLGIPPSEPRPDAADEAAAKRVDLLTKYRQWRKDLFRRPELVAAVAILIEEHPLRQVERLHHWRNGTARARLVTALRHFAALRGNTPRWGRNWLLQRT